jgi:hypothetical protein
MKHGSILRPRITPDSHADTDFFEWVFDLSVEVGVVMRRCKKGLEHPA